MTTIMSALDEFTPVQYGENGHREYGWSLDYKEKIMQLSFQLTRTQDKTQQKILGDKYYELIKDCFHNITDLSETEPDDCKQFRSILYRIMLNTRDIIDGKGEYQLFYILLGQWVKFSHMTKNDKTREICQHLANEALISCVKLQDPEHGYVKGYGSWKDVKYFLNHLRTLLDYSACSHDSHLSLPIFKTAIGMFVSQLKDDSMSDRPSLLARWIPREKSSLFGWQAFHIAEMYFADWGSCDKEKSKLANKKRLTHYRQLIAKINAKIKTIQINQCNGTWGEIDFDKSGTSLTISKQKRAFLNVTKKGLSRTKTEYDDDRIQCKINFENYVSKCASGEISIKGCRSDIINLVKDAINTNHSVEQTVSATINLQWNKLGESVQKLSNFIAMVDTSGSMTSDDALYAAIGLGCRVAEKSKLGKRVLTFNDKPCWINLDGQDSLTEMARTLSTNSQWGMTTNIVAAFQLILDACVLKQLPPCEVKDLVLVIFSDMQFNDAQRGTCNIHDTIKLMFAEAGLKTKHKTEYSVPHILYWNLRSTNGFPTKSSTQNVSMLSGYNAATLNIFCEKGMEVLENCSPWVILLEQLNNKRYSWADKLITQEPEPDAPEPEPDEPEPDEPEPDEPEPDEPEPDEPDPDEPEPDELEPELKPDRAGWFSTFW